MDDHDLNNFCVFIEEEEERELEEHNQNQSSVHFDMKRALERFNIKINVDGFKRIRAKHKNPPYVLTEYNKE